MRTTLPPKGQIAEIGSRYYREKLAPVLEPQHNGKYLLLDVDTGDYEMGADEVELHNRMVARHPGKIFYVTRVGYCFTIGGR